MKYLLGSLLVLAAVPAFAATRRASLLYKTYFCLLASVGVLLSGGLSARAEVLDSSKFAWALRFTTSGYDGESALANFPVLVRLSETDIEGFRYADIGSTTNAAYASLRFADADGNSLDYEIEEWDAAGTSAVWVSLPELSDRSTRFYAYYAPGAEAVLPAVHPTNVWTSAGYVGVWHLSSIVKNNSGSYKAYNDPLWGHVFPDSTGRGADATKGSTSWDTYLQNAPGVRFAESLGRANGTLGANAYTPFLVPPTVDGGGAGDWSFSTTGYSTEAWVFPFRSHNILSSGQTSDPASSDGFIYAATNGVRLCAGDWGGSTVPWSPDKANESFWHFVTAVWTPSSSSNPSVLYGTSGDGAPTKLIERSGKHATDQCATYGMLLAGGSGVDFGLDEIRVRRGLSTPDWIQANWDSQRVGTDFLEVGVVHRIGDPAVSAVGENTATAVLDFSIARFGDSAKALFVNFVTGATNIVAVADLENPSATAAGLAADTDYDVRFVVENAGEVVRETAFTSFTTAGRAVLNPKSYRYSVTFTASGYDGTETLEHFPVLVRLSETAVPGFSYAGVDPADIRFTAVDGELLAHEVEKWDPTGTSVIWVALPELSGTDTSFTMHWRPFPNAGVPAQPAYRVWKYAGYVGVWHINACVQINGIWGYEDSSGGNATLFGQNDGSVAEPSSNALYNANGTPWATGGRTSTKRTSGWTFSQTGYSVESWISTRDQPGYNNGTARNGYMFASEANTDNGAEAQWRPSNGLQFYPTYISILGGSVNATVVTSNPAWPDDATNDWHFISAVWPQEGSTELSTLYEAGAGYSSHGTNLRILRTVNRRAIDFTGERGMGILGSSDFQGNGCYYDEARVRRGLSSKDWIQANWDTQRVGSDFLVPGEVKGLQGFTIIFK